MIGYAVNLNIELCRKYPDYTFVFGDNLLGYGKAGQAQIRDEVNALGIPTKRMPSMQFDAFFKDTSLQDWDAVIKQLAVVDTLLSSKSTVIFPKHGLGTGLAKLPLKAPNIHNFITSSIAYFRVKYGVLTPEIIE